MSLQRIAPQAGSAGPTGPTSASPFARKTNGTNRQSTTTLTDDPELSFVLPVGTYAMHAVVYGGSPPAAGIKINFHFTGAFLITPFITVQQISDSNTLAPLLTTMNVDSFLNFTTSAANTMFTFDTTYVVSTAGTYSFQWAQVTSTATNTALYAGSQMTAFKLA